MFAAIVLIHGQKNYVCSKLGALTPNKAKALLFDTAHKASVESEKAGGSSDCELFQ